MRCVYLVYTLNKEATMMTADKIGDLVEMVALLKDQLQFHIAGYAITKADEGRSHSLIQRAEELLR
jgi:hypothetical protein